MSRTDDPPQEHPHPSTADRSVGGARSHIFPVQLTETAGALRAQHGPTEQAQCRVLPLIIRRLGTPEDKRRFNLHTFLQEMMNEMTLTSKLLEMAGLIEESTIILGKINQTIPSPGISEEGVYGLIITEMLSITK